MATTLALPYSSVLSVPSLRILGNDTGASRSAKGLTAAEVRSMLTVPTLAEVAAAYQPLDGDLTSIAALTTTAFGRGLLTLADASAGRTSFDVYSTTQINASLATKADLVGGVIPSSQIPAIAITEYLGTVANQAAMLALNGDRGDWCLRSDLGTTWVLSADDSTLLASWTQLNYPTAPVTSVNGSTGAVVLNAASVGAQASDAELTALAGLTSAADRLPYFTGSGSAALATFTAFGRTLVDDADAATARGTLGLAIGTNVQAFDADLSSLAAASGTNTIYYRSAADTWSPVTIGANLTFTGGTLAATGGGGMSIGDAVSGATAGSILFAGSGSVLAQDNTNLFWDDTNNKLGIGTTTPTYEVTIRKALPGLRLEMTSAAVPNYSSVGFNPAVTSTTIAQWSYSQPTRGGVFLAGFTSSAGGTDCPPIEVAGYLGSNTPAQPAVSIEAWKHNGATNRTAVVAGEQAIRFRSGTNSIFAIDGTGGLSNYLNRFEIRNGANPQRISVFETFTSATSFGNLSVRATGSDYKIYSLAGSGGGSSRSIRLGQMATDDSTFTHGLSVNTTGEIEFGDPTTKPHAKIYASGIEGILELSRPGTAGTHLVIRAHNTQASALFSTSLVGLYFDSTRVSVGPANGTLCGIGQSVTAHTFTIAADFNTTRNRAGSTLVLCGGDAFSTDNGAGVTLLKSGRGTGAGAGGKVTIQTTVPEASGTTLQTFRDVAEFDANTTSGETPLLLLDLASGTMKRVSIGAADSGGTGYKVLRVPN